MRWCSLVATFRVSDEGREGYMGDGPEFYERPWRDPEKWRALTSGEACPICAGDGKPYGIVAELDASYLTTARDRPFRGYCCLVLKRHAVELHDLSDEEAASLMDDMRPHLAGAQGRDRGREGERGHPHGNTLPHLHAHFFARYVGDPHEDGPIDFRLAEDTGEFAFSPEEFQRFVAELRAAVEAA